jgi:deazaflavin-dependent oxidoreductase (nitroreductase family)
MWKIGLGKAINIWPSGIGRIMVIKHRGRRSGREYLTPVNYAIVEGQIYCIAGFGSISDWYRNTLVNPNVELWLPEGKKFFCAEDVSDSPDRLFLLRQVAIASGFAGPLLGINQKKLDDKQLDEVSKDYRLVHFTEMEKE